MHTPLKKASVCILAVLAIVIPISTVEALSPEQVLALKKEGVSEETIQIMIRQEKEALSGGPYDRFGTHEIRDESGHIAVIYSTGKITSSSQSAEEREKVEKAWKMLESLIIEKKD